MSFVQCLLLVFLSVGALSKPFGTPSIAKRQDTTPTTPGAPESTACGDIVVGSHNGFFLFYASDAFECLQSVPFNGAVAARFIDYYNTTLQFQSTLAFLKDPPEGYQQPPVDVMAVLESIKANATAGAYPNQYAFEADVQLLINRMHDAHVVLNAGVLQPFTFASPYGIISASVDGKNAPEIYIADHVLRCQSLGCQPNPVTHINGVEVVEYLSQYAELNSQGYLEPHADWNTLMDNPVRDILGELSVFQSGTFYPGDALNFTLKNQDPINTYWLSLFIEQQETGPLTTGGDFYNFFVLGFLPASYNETDVWWPIFPPDNSTTDSNSTDYPPPVCSSDTQNWCEDSSGAFPDNPTIVQSDLSGIGGGVVTGYIYDSIDTGVLSIPTFDQFGNNTENFQNAVDWFITNSTSRNTSHIIIDLQHNEGGSIFLAYQTFKQFFATIDPYAASRIRSHHLSDILGDAYNSWWTSLESNLTDEANAINYGYYAASEWVVTNRINTETGTNFSSWQEYAQPIVDRGDTFSIPQRFNLSDEVFDASAFDNWVPFGYGIAKPEDDPANYVHWAPEDITILTDGICSSSCALFVEMMAHQAGVRVITVGGRPVTGPMQAVSGSRAARVYSADAIDDDILYTNYDVDNQTAVQALPNRSDTGMWVQYAGFSIADQIRENDPVPLQFKYQAADCRLYYTLANVYNLTQLWHDVAAAAWTTPSLCVANSTGYPTARTTTNSTNPPPIRTAQTPNLNLDLDTVNQVSFALNNTGGLADLNAARPQGEIIACTSASACGSKTPCQPVSLNCGSPGSPNVRSRKACTPPCSVDKDCKGRNTKCFHDVPADSKQNSAYGGGATNARAAGFSGTLHFGHCYPLADSKFLRVCG
ncbi:hypothetical protein EJ04DRAFT_504715 [Polyplosphaeria fusca]|uniref:CPAF-like PDZ domain-containing protein n=1 Tax=Polyplosphaeria fusca TaxID=682080 RepID=A0A9P4QMA9_9PLEO|nr:hypothetical protein EJ04DRAFT_504715 [Polyplosphaeria fusca]